MSLKVVRWVFLAVGGLLVVLWIAVALGSRTETLRRLVTEQLAERLQSEIELAAFSVDTFPTVSIRGEGLVVRLGGRRDVPPLVLRRRPSNPPAVPERRAVPFLACCAEPGNRERVRRIRATLRA